MPLIKEDAKWLREVIETFEQFGQTLNAGFYGQEIAIPVTAPDVEEIRVQQKRTITANKAFAGEEEQEYSGNITQPQVFHTEKLIQHPTVKQVVGQPEGEKVYVTPATNADAGQLTVFPAQAEVSGITEETKPNPAEKPVQAETRDWLNEQVAWAIPVGNLETEAQQVPQSQVFGQTTPPLTENEQETEKDYPEYRPLKGLHDFAAFFSGNSGAIDKLSTVEEQPLTLQVDYISEEKDHNHAVRSEPPSSFSAQPIVSAKENAGEAILYQTPTKPQTQKVLNDLSETNDLQTEQSLRPTPPVVPDMDVDDILEALTRKLQREYRRYYGS